MRLYNFMIKEFYQIHYYNIRIDKMESKIDNENQPVLNKNQLKKIEKAFIQLADGKCNYVTINSMKGWLDKINEDVLHCIDTKAILMKVDKGSDGKIYLSEFTMFCFHFLKQVQQTRQFLTS